MTLEDKYKKLEGLLREMGEIVIAYSGGVDSTFLLRVAVDVLGDKALGILATSATYPTREFKEAVSLAEKMRAQLRIIETKETDNIKFSENPPDRCYFCKSELFTKVQEIAQEEGIKFVADGSNLDDVGDFRPGMRALKEQQVRSPLREAQFTKNDIREMSRRLGLPTWNKPSLACLSSRFPYGSSIDLKKLTMVDRAENFLQDNGFSVVRVRHYEDTARIELSDQEIARFLEPEIRNHVVKEFKDIGYKYVTLDLQGYRTGSMNEVLSVAEKLEHTR